MGLEELLAEINKLNEIIEKLKSGKVEEDLAIKLKETISEDYELIAKKCVDEYYKYTPTVYTNKYRQKSLYNAYKIIEHNGELDIDFNHQYMDDFEHRVSNKYIFDKMFMEGWHGGADMNGRMKYPYKKIKGEFIKYNGEDGKPYTKEYDPWRWSASVAKEKISPYKLIVKNKNRYENNKPNCSGKKIENTIRSVVAEVFSKYGF